MIQLAQGDRKKIRDVIVSAYVTSDRLANFLFSELEKNLEVEAGTGPLDVVAFRLVQQAISRGYIEDLILAIARDTEDREDIQKLCARVLRQRIVLNPEESLVDGLTLELDPTDWDVDIESVQLEAFIPRRFSFQADVGKLRQGLDLASAVCKITFTDRPLKESGTGVLIAPDLVLTNYHVLSMEAGADLNRIAQSAQFEFGYVSTQAGHTQTLTAISAKPVEAYSPIRELDYAVIRLDIPDLDGFKVEPVPLNPTDNLGRSSPLNMLQHPAGEALKVSLSNNGVVEVDEAKGLVLYVNPTKGGSSGSPCFDDDWQLIAIHHKSKQTSFASVREGILFSAIYHHLKEEFNLEMD